MDYGQQSRGLRKLLTASVTVLILAIALCVQSCRSSKTTSSKDESKAETELRTTEAYEVVTCIDTVVVHEADTAMMSALVRCDSLGNAYLEQIMTLQGERVKQNMTTERQQDGGLKICTDAIAQATEDHVEIYECKWQYADATMTHQEQKTRLAEKTTKKPPGALRAFLAGLMLGAAGTCLLMLYLKEHNKL